MTTLKQIEARLSVTSMPEDDAKKVISQLRKAGLKLSGAPDRHGSPSDIQFTVNCNSTAEQFQDACTQLGLKASTTSARGNLGDIKIKGIKFHPKNAAHKMGWLDINIA